LWHWCPSRRVISVTGRRDAPPPPARHIECQASNIFAFYSLREQPPTSVFARRCESHCASNAALYNVTTSMISDRIGDAVATLAVVCVLTIFLFPAMQGPYSVVYGPATALLAVRAAAKVQTAIVQAALRSLGALASLLVALREIFVAQTTHHTFTLHERSAILRC